jgi:type IV pilus assembly protein PilA
MRNSIKSQSGFSLIELMVVVGIIGILASIAVPQFSKFQAKARQSEAKTSLAALYTAEKGFFSEYSGYFGAINLVGFNPEGNQRYSVGFAAIGALPIGYALPAAPAPLPNTSNPNLACSNAGVASICTFVGPGPFAYVNAGSAVAGGVTFTAGANGNPNSTAAVNIDTWTINQNKVLGNTINGIN